MHAATPALAVTALVVVCVCSGLLWQWWVLRRSFEIAARAPRLVGVSGVASLTLLLAVLLHWILLLEGKGLPCYVMMFSSYLWLAVFVVPYCLRAFRLVVAYDTPYRLKYAKFVKGPVIVTISVTIGIGIALAALFVFLTMPERYSRDKRGCFFFQERLAVMVALILSAGPSVFVLSKLAQVHDVFGIGPENVRVIVPIQISGVIFFTVHELVRTRVLQDSRNVHFLMELLLVADQSNIIFCSALVPVARYYGWVSGGKVTVLPVEGHSCRSDCDKEGVYDFAHEGGEVAEMFGEFCRKHLCMESWDYIVDSVAYKDRPSSKTLDHLSCPRLVHELSNPQEQFARFVHILDKYLRPRSPQEVNVGSAMQERLLKFETRSTFTSLHEVTRNTILAESVGEIVLMLDQNLLAKFKLTPEMQQRKQRGLLEFEIQSAHEVADGDQSMLELMTSVSVARAGSPETYEKRMGQSK